MSWIIESLLFSCQFLSVFFFRLDNFCWIFSRYIDPFFHNLQLSDNLTVIFYFRDFASKFYNIHLDFFFIFPISLFGVSLFLLILIIVSFWSLNMFLIAVLEIPISGLESFYWSFFSLKYGSLFSHFYISSNFHCILISYNT